jgi:hypothetical protein
VVWVQVKSAGQVLTLPSPVEAPWTLANLPQNKTDLALARAPDCQATAFANVQGVAWPFASLRLDTNAYHHEEALPLASSH